MQIDIPWYPQPRQADLFRAAGLMGLLDGTATEPGKPIARLIGYGGAAFGGKTDGMIGLATAAAFAWPGCKIGYFRRTYTELEGADGAIERARSLLAGVADYNGGEHRMTFPTGSRLYFCHCQHESDRFSYQSQAWDILMVDEATHFTWTIIDYLLTRNRSTGDSGIVPYTVMGSNPGNVGHTWFMDLFDILEADGAHEQVKRRLNPNGKYEQSYFIPAYLEDNPIGNERDPEYGDRLERRDPEVARALRHGDWTVFAGQAFRSWSRARHVVAPYEIPVEFPRWRAVDYGFDHPFVCGWYARELTTGRVIKYREVARRGLTDTQQAELIQDMTTPGEEIVATYASPDMWARKTSDSRVFTSVDEYKSRGVILTKADNDRLGGKRKIDRLLADMPDGRPGLIVFDHCKETIRVMPTLIRAELNPEDVQKVDGDDAYDELRYGLTNIRNTPAANTEQVIGINSPFVRVQTSRTGVF